MKAFQACEVCRWPKATQHMVLDRHLRGESAAEIGTYFRVPATKIIYHLRRCIPRLWRLGQDRQARGTVAALAHIASQHDDLLDALSLAARQAAAKGDVRGTIAAVQQAQRMLDARAKVLLEIARMEAADAPLYARPYRSLGGIDASPCADSRGGDG
jgi:hypothetical protein